MTSAGRLPSAVVVVLGRARMSRSCANRRGIRWSSYFPQRRIAPKETTVSQATAETITVGQLGVRFLVEGSDSNGSVSVFECYVPANARMSAPHSHDAFEETIYGLKGTTSWTVEGESIGIGAGEALCVPRGAVHGFQTAAAPTRRSSRSPAQESSDPPTSERSGRCWPPPPAARRTSPRWPR